MHVFTVQTDLITTLCKKKSIKRHCTDGAQTFQKEDSVPDRSVVQLIKKAFDSHVNYFSSCVDRVINCLRKNKVESCANSIAPSSTPYGSVSSYKSCVNTQLNSESEVNRIKDLYINHSMNLETLIFDHPTVTIRFSLTPATCSA